MTSLSQKYNSYKIPKLFLGVKRLVHPKVSKEYRLHFKGSVKEQNKFHNYETENHS